MDILKPPIIVIGKRRYRRNVVTLGISDSLSLTQQEQNYENEMQCNVEDEIVMENLDFKTTNSGYTLAVNIPSAYFKFIIGKKGETKKRIESETKTQIHVPGVGEEKDTVISGLEKSTIASAKRRLEMIVASHRHRQPFTHFLAYPMNADALQEKLKEFKLDVLRQCGDVGHRGIDETIFQNPCKMHLTLGTLVLLNQREVDEAVTVLSETRQLIESAGVRNGIPVRVTDLEYMNDDPSDVDVLYAKIHSLGRASLLDDISQKIVDLFTQNGLMEHEYDRVKIHMTVMNSLTRKDPAAAVYVPANHRKQKDRESFDATKLLQMFQNFDFGECIIPSLDICQRHGTDCKGYYTTVGSLSLL